MISRRIHVHGKVQGVFFRAATKEKAYEIGIQGWVRNQDDGTVLIEAVGEETAIEEFIDWCHEGPLLARVSKVDIVPGEYMNHQGFEITY